MSDDLFQCYHCDEIYLSHHHQCLECDKKYCEFCIDEVFDPLLTNNCKKIKEYYDECIYCTENYEKRDFKEKDILVILCDKYNKSIDKWIEECRDYLYKCNYFSN